MCLAVTFLKSLAKKEVQGCLCLLNDMICRFLPDKQSGILFFRSLIYLNLSPDCLPACHERFCRHKRPDMTKCCLKCGAVLTPEDVFCFYDSCVRCEMLNMAEQQEARLLIKSPLLRLSRLQFRMRRLRSGRFRAYRWRKS